MCDSQVKLRENVQALQLVFAVDHNAAALLGRSWIKAFDMIRFSDDIAQLVESPTKVKLDEMLDEARLNALRVKVCSLRDPVISSAIEYSLRGWSHSGSTDETISRTLVLRNASS